MSSTTFVNGVTLTDDDWFNDVNRLHYTIFNDPADLAAAFARLDSLSADTAGVASADTLVFYDVSDATSNKTTFVNAMKGINTFTEDTTPDISADFVMTYDASAASAKKVRVQNLSPLVTVATQSASAALQTFSIASGAKKIIMSLVGVSTNGTSQYVGRVGDSGGVAVTGYLSSSVAYGSTTAAALTTGFALENGGAATTINHGQLILVRLNTAGTIWSASWQTGRSDNAGGHQGAGSVTLSAELDRVAWTTVGGTDVGDAGIIGVQYEL